MTATKTIEALARVVQSAWDDGGDVAANLPPIEFTDAEKRHLVRAVLAHLRDNIAPGMIAAADKVAGEQGDDAGDYYGRIFTAMINAALGGPS